MRPIAHNVRVWEQALEDHWSQEKAGQLGDFIRAVRYERGLSQESIAHAAGITRNQMQLIEAGRASGRRDGDPAPANPTLRTIAGLAYAFGMSIEQFMGKAGL